MSDAHPLFSPQAAGLTRRRFIRGAGAAATGAALLGDPLLSAARGGDKPDQDKPDKPNKKKFHSTAKRPTCIAAATEGTVVTSDDEGRLTKWTVGVSASPQIKSAAAHGGKKAAFVTFSDKTSPPRAFTAGYDGNVILHDIEHLDDSTKHKTFTRHREGAPKREVWVVAVSPDGKHAVSAANDGQILLWETDKLDNGTVTPFGDFEGPVGGLAWVPKPGGAPATQFLSTHAGGDVHLWDLESSKTPVRHFTHDNSQPVNAVAVEKNGKFFVSAGFDLTLRMWDLTDPKATKPLKTLKGHKNWVWRVAISSTGEVAASAGEDGFLRLWNLKGDSKVIQPTASFGKFEDGVMGVTFLEDKRLVFTAAALNAQKPLAVQSI